MDLQALKNHLTSRKKDIEAELGRLSAIYNTKSSSSHPKPTNPMNPPVLLSQDDRLKLLAVENERLRAMLKSLAKNSEDELRILNGLSAELGGLSEQEKKKWAAEVENLKARLQELESGLRVKSAECQRLAELNQILNGQVSLKDEEIAQFKIRLSNLKSEILSADEIKKPRDDLDKLYREKLNALSQTIKSLQEEKALIKMENQNLHMKLKEPKPESRMNLPQADPNLFADSHVLQRTSKIYEELSSIKSELANMGKQQANGQPNHAQTPEQFFEKLKSAAVYKEKIKALKRERLEITEKLVSERKRGEIFESAVDQLRKEKSELWEKLSKTKAKLKQLASNPEHKIADSHIRHLEQQLSAKKEESDRLQSEKTFLETKIEDLKSQVSAKTSQIEQLNSTLLKFAGNFKAESLANPPSNPRLLSDTPNAKAQQFKANNFRSVYKNFPRIEEGEEPDLHFDLSLNIPPDFEQFEHENLGHFNKLKNVVKDLNEKQHQHIKNLELKNSKIKDLKKSSKNLKREFEELQKENNNLKQSALVSENKTKRLEEENSRFIQEKRILKNDVEEFKEKLAKAEDGLEKMGRVQRENKRFEHETEYFQKLSDQKSLEIENLLRSLRERDDFVKQAMTRSQFVQENLAQEEQSSVLFSNNKKLKKFLKRLQEDFFKLEEENKALKEAIEREIELRDQIVEDFTEKALLFENKIEVFAEFEKNLEEFKNYFSTVTA